MELEIFLISITDVQILRNIGSKMGIRLDHQLNPKFVFLFGELMQIHLTRLSKIKAYFIFPGQSNVLWKTNEKGICLTGG